MHQHKPDEISRVVIPQNQMVAGMRNTFGNYPSYKELVINHYADKNDEFSLEQNGRINVKKTNTEKGLKVDSKKKESKKSSPNKSVRKAIKEVNIQNPQKIQDYVHREGDSSEEDIEASGGDESERRGLFLGGEKENTSRGNELFVSVITKKGIRSHISEVKHV